MQKIILALLCTLILAGNVFVENIKSEEDSREYYNNGEVQFIIEDASVKNMVLNFQGGSLGSSLPQKMLTNLKGLP